MRKDFLFNKFCGKTSKYCSKYLCQLPNFDSGESSHSFTLNLALIPSQIKIKEFEAINFRIISEIKIEDKVKFETEISSTASMSIFMARDVPIIDEPIELWVLMSSAGFAIFILIITVIILIRVRIYFYVYSN